MHRRTAGAIPQTLLNGNLPGWTGCRDVADEMCQDVTALVRAYVAQGGTL